ncbi:MAG: iron hydrogenase small subunit [Desulfovibrio sp.]|jgi:ferredoxin hydrogenase small subunit|nr:iron hydrogenase small subunit [Desulfovibrio sp.]
MYAVTVTRRSLLKAGMVLGLAALFGIRMTSKAAAAVTELKSFMQKRLDGVYKADSAFTVRASQDNAQVQALYADFLHEPGSHKAHELLHMHFIDRSAGVKRLLAEGKTANRGADEFRDPTYPYEWVS